MSVVSNVAGIRELTLLKEVDEVIADSQRKPVFIFKHSTTCSLSTKALIEFEQFVKHIENDKFDFVMVVIREHRDVSDAIAEKLGVQHESPQAIFLANGQSLWNDSHYEITESKLRQVVIMYENGDFKD